MDPEEKLKAYTEIIDLVDMVKQEPTRKNLADLLLGIGECWLPDAEKYLATVKRNAIDPEGIVQYGGTTRQQLETEALRVEHAIRSYKALASQLEKQRTNW